METTEAFISNLTTEALDYNITSLDNTTAQVKKPPAAPPVSVFDYPEYGLGLDMYPVHTFIFIILGMLGNTIALMVILRKNMRGMSSAVFIFILAVSDNLALLAFLLGMVTLIYTQAIINDSFCKFYFFLQSVGSMISAWTVVAMSFERVLIVTFPLKAPNWTSRTRVIICEIIVIVCLVLHNIHFVWTAKENQYQSLCEYDYVTYSSFLGNWSIYDACISSYVPLVLIFMMNGIIITQMKRASNIQKAMSNKPASKQNGSKQPGGSMNATNQITIMLLSVSVAFFICMVPYGFFQIYVNYIVDMHTISLKAYAKVFFANQICLILWETNHSINLILYSLTGRKFRNELLSMFSCGKYGGGKPRSTSYATESTNIRTTNGATSMTSVSTVSSKVV